MRNLWRKMSSNWRFMMDQDDKLKLHSHILDIFQEIIRVCDDCHITYFIMGGTALGAVRHGGFIPWDDDLDIGMMRQDYERFLREAPRCLRQDLFLQTYETEKKSPFYFAKVRKSHTKFVEKYCRNLHIHDGIYVDIFPYDNIPDAKVERNNYYKKSKILLNLYIAKCLTGTSVEYSGWKNLCYKSIRTIFHILLLPIPKSFLFRLVDKNLQRYNSSDTEYVGYGGLPKIQVPKNDVVSPAEIKFEGLMVKCPRNIENYLHDNFGDYRQLPPKNERKGHAPYKMQV